MIVVDAGAFVELLIRSDAGLLAEQVVEDEDGLFAPHLFDAEVFHRLVRAGKHGALEVTEVRSAVDDLRDAPITRVDHRPLLARALGASAALSGYDALYVALAQTLGCPLLTADARLARAVREQFRLPVTEVTGSGR